jgi:hypothetical protein
MLHDGYALIGQSGLLFVHGTAYLIASQLNKIILDSTIFAKSSQQAASLTKMFLWTEIIVEERYVG